VYVQSDGQLSASAARNADVSEPSRADFSLPWGSLSRAPLPFTPWQTAARIFITCWLIYSVHVATNVAREHYLAFAIGDHFSFKVDDYQGLHPDLFEKPGYGWHINSNPGVSMLAAIPYALARPVIDPVVSRVRQARAASGQQEPPAYSSPWPNARAFYAEAWRRGFDIKLGLGALVTQVAFMAPVSAFFAVAMFFVLRLLFRSDRTALWLTLLYAFGTPVFFRTGYLNHNLLVGYAAFAGFLALWNPGSLLGTRRGLLDFVAGIGGGLAVLLDYTGVVMLGALFLYGAALAWDAQRQRGASLTRFIVRYGLGAAIPLGLLAFYQWASFGDAIQPAQRWMPNVAWAGSGYRGMSPPMPDLLWSNLFDYRYGLFTSCPLVLLALAQPWADRPRLLPRREAWTMLAMFAAFWIFCGGVNYGRLQFNTGVRYMTALLPFLFLLSAVVLRRLPPRVLALLVLVSVTLSWCLAMHRDVERGLGVLDPVLHVFIGGFELPLLTTLSRIGGGFSEFVARGVSPIPIFLLVAALLAVVWGTGRRTSTSTART
jgi:hypothetical protein